MSLGKTIIHIYYTNYDANLRYSQQYSKVLCIKVFANNNSYNRTLISLFLLGMKNRKYDNRISDESHKCMPTKIAEEIEKIF